MFDLTDLELWAIIKRHYNGKNYKKFVYYAVVCSRHLRRLEAYSFLIFQ